jgi:hypothetical protein
MIKLHGEKLTEPAVEGVIYRMLAQIYTFLISKLEKQNQSIQIGKS